MKQPDYFAELYVAGRFAGAGWNVYFPRRDRGLDFIISRPADAGMQLLRPVQVKGKYPTDDKTDKAVYGYIGGLTELHPDMVLAIPYFTSELLATPCCVAYLPLVSCAATVAAIDLNLRLLKTVFRSRGVNTRSFSTIWE